MDSNAEIDELEMIDLSAGPLESSNEVEIETEIGESIAYPLLRISALQILADFREKLV